VPAGSGFYSEGGKEGANYVHRNTPHIHYDSTKHRFLPPKIAGEEMASKYYKLEQLAPFAPRVSSKPAISHLWYTEPPEKYQPTTDYDALQ
jgi:hypothetical protein